MKNMNPGPRTPSEGHYGNAPKQTLHNSKGKVLNMKFSLIHSNNSDYQGEGYEWCKYQFEDCSKWEEGIILEVSDTPSSSATSEYFIKYTSWFWFRGGALLNNTMIQILYCKRRIIYWEEDSRIIIGVALSYICYWGLVALWSESDGDTDLHSLIHLCGWGGVLRGFLFLIHDRSGGNLHVHQHTHRRMMSVAECKQKKQNYQSAHTL